MLERTNKMKNRILIIILLLLSLSACTSADSVEALNEKIKDLEISQLALTEENDTLKAQNEVTDVPLNEYGYPSSIKYKDVLDIEAKVLEKQKGDALYPFYVLVSQEDVDHNTPLLLTIEDEALFNNYEAGKIYDFKVYTEVVAHKESGNVRFMFMIVTE